MRKPRPDPKNLGDPPGRRKLQTRRVVRIDDTPISESDVRKLKHQRGIPSKAADVRMIAHYLKCDAPAGSFTVSARVDCPYGLPGDVLRVKETWAVDKRYDYCSPSQIPESAHSSIWYEADEPDDPTPEGTRGRWRMARYMPTWAYRLTITLNRIGAQHLQRITHDDIMDEGILKTIVDSTWVPRASVNICKFGFMTDADGAVYETSHEAWKALWDSLNAHRGFGWATNPVVWILHFTLNEPA